MDKIILTALMVFSIVFGIAVIIGTIGLIVDECREAKDKSKWSDKIVMFALGILSIVFGVYELIKYYNPEETIVVDGYTYVLVTDEQPEKEISRNNHTYVLVEE